MSLPNMLRFYCMTIFTQLYPISYNNIKMEGQNRAAVGNEVMLVHLSFYFIVIAVHNIVE